MKSFSEQADKLLLFLKENVVADWNELYDITGIQGDHPLYSRLKDKYGYVEYTRYKIHITKKGIDFISQTSFVKERDKTGI